MDVEGRRIYPDADADGIEYEPRDWRLCEGPFVRHLPTATIFRIGCNDEALEKRSARLDDFYAQLVHFCDHRYEADQGLDDETLTFLGRGGIAFYLQAIGAWKPNVISYPERPEHKKMRKNWPKPR